ncbi:MAG TPA: hypothetical protein VK131_03605 [Candidatus Acidoferrales bacterium]|nr:hypothetical protein [Candidatus Acidoferrales bacterium]
MAAALTERLAAALDLGRRDPGAGRSRALVLAAAAAAAMLVRDLILLWIFSFSVSRDTQSYLSGDAIRTRPYHVLAQLTRAADQPLVLVLVQIALAALAAAALVYVIGRWNLLLAAAIGLLMAADLNWAITNRWLMTESASLSFLVLSLACLAYQYENRELLHPLGLAAAGALFGWTLTIRPSTLPLALPLLAGYLWFTRSWLKTAWLAAGLAAVLLASALLTLYQVGRFQLSGQTGVYLAFPLLTYHLLSPDNGPSSRDIDTALRSCYPDLDYSAIYVENSNEYFWVRFEPCLDGQGWSSQRISDEFASAYLEGVRSRPGQWTRDVFDWTLIALRNPIYNEELTGRECTAYRWCTRWAAGVEACSTSATCAAAAVWESRLARLSQPLEQLPVALLSLETGRHFNALAEGRLIPLPLWFEAAVLMTWAALGALVWFGTRGPLRLLGAASLVYVVYFALSTVAGHVFIPRYSLLLSPFESILSALALMVVAALILGAVRRLVRRRR